MSKIRIIPFIGLTSIIFNFVASQDIIVETSGGKIQGYITRTRRGRDIYTFQGIRYAEAPINENRFKPPKPVKNWDGVYKATIPGQACMQNDPSPGLKVSEDCLFLDVYSTDLNASRPVIVFIHGGSFKGGAKSLASPEYILDKDIVLVSMNYRLGPFGYFSTGSKEASGNQGFKDQVLAMKWIRDNVKAFGGDPNLITLSGQSAGSFSVSLHLLSKQSVGLFHRAIGMSGSAVSFFETQTRRSSFYLEIRTLCVRFTKEAIVKCLQKKPADDILKIDGELIRFLPWYYDIESENDDEPFLTELPVNIARRGEIQKIPIMCGVTLDEFFSVVYINYQKYSILFRLVLSPLHNYLLPYLLMYDRNPKKYEISTTLYSYYLHNQPITSKNLRKFGALVSDAGIRHGVHRLVEYSRRFTDVYYYLFEYQGRYSTVYYPDGQPLGVLHEDDLQYPLVLKKIAPVVSIDDPENPIIERMTGWWAKFAETGNPNDPSNNATNDVIWEPSDATAIRAVYINESSAVSSEFLEAEFKLWDSLFPLYRD